MTGPRNVRGAHECTKHEPGKRACYVAHGCRCRPCTDDATTTARRYKWIHGNGRSTKVPGTIIRDHLARLRAAGMSTAAIAQASGVAPATFRNIETGRVRDVQRHNALALLAAKPVPIAQQRVGFVDGTGTRRRLQALAAIGWTGPALAAKLGRSRTRVRAILRGDGEVSAALRARVMALYDDLWDQPQTGTQSLRAALAAQRHGWAPPLAWDDDSIDNPDARPDLGGRTAAIATDDGMITSATIARIENTRDLLDAGETPEHIAARLGVNLETLRQSLSRHAPDLVAPFRAACSRQRRTTAA